VTDERLQLTLEAARVARERLKIVRKAIHCETERSRLLRKQFDELAERVAGDRKDLSDSGFSRGAKRI
jgi:hypothetical protein